MRPDPRRGRRAEQRRRFSDGFFQVAAQPDGFHRSVAQLRPFVAENHPRIPLPIDVQRPVERLPRSRRQASLAVLAKRAFRTVRNENSRSEQTVCRTAHRREQIIFALISMALGRPETLIAPKIRSPLKNCAGPLPSLQIAARKNVEPVSAGRPVHIVSPVRRIGQHERVADMHPVGRNARRQNVPVLRIQTAERQQCEQPYRKTWFLHIKKRVG